MFREWLRALRRAVGLPARRAPAIEAVLEATPNWIALLIQGHLVYANGSVRRLLGVASRRELIGRPLVDFVDPAARERTQELLAEAERSGESVPSFELELRAADGARIVLEAWVAPVRYQRRNALLIHGRDQSRRLRGEAELRERETRYRLLAENSSDVVTEYSADGQLLWVSPSIERQLGYPVDRWLGELAPNVLALTHPADLPRAFEAFEDGQLRPTIDLLQRIRHADGEYRWLETHGRRFDAPDGTRRVVMTTRDVTERQRMLDALRESEERFQSLARAVPVGLFRIDKRGRHVFLNERWSELTGIPVEEGLGALGTQWLHADDAAQILELSRKALAERRPLRLEQRVVRRDGSVRWVLNQAIAEFDAGGEFAGWVGTLTDLSDKKAAEQALAASEQQLRLALEAADMCTWEWDAPSRRVSWSANAPRVFELAPGESMPSEPDAVAELIQPGDATLARAYARDQIRKGEGFEVELRLAARPDREQRWVLMRGHASPARPGAAVGVVAEVTQRRRFAEERAALEARLRESQRLESLGLLAGGVAHDFNNLLVGILGNADLALRRPLGDPLLRECLAEIQHAGERAAGLVRQILAFAGSERIERAPVNLCPLVDDTLALLRANLPANARVTWQAPQPASWIDGDATQLRQVLMNLVTNACEALPAEGGDVALRVVPPEPGITPEWVTLEVSDSGCGVDAKALAKIFDPFFTTKGAGRGLGLAVAHGIVRAHGGNLLVESTPGVGTRMRVLLPAPLRRAAPAPAGVTLAEAAQVLARGTILVVDDERGVREVARRALEFAGYRVLLAESGTRALEQLRTHPGQVSAVVLDLTLATESGEIVFEALRELAPEIPVLAASGYASERALARLESQGLAGFLQKPFTVARLTEAIDAALRGGPAS
ncbi:MAG TPA: PAS domain S-box protein [Myxococcota bacterium]|nr:PAS domain S-box protein [Myxococcota bacterium]